MTTDATIPERRGRPRRLAVRDAATIEALEREALEGPGVTSGALRRAILEGGDLPPAVAAYVERVRERSYDVTQADLDALLAAGYDEDAVFEITVLAAVGTARSILDATLRTIEEM